MVPNIVPFSLATLMARRRAAQPWLILGKGPSSATYSPSLVETYCVMALNHAVRGSRALVGHAIDIEVFDQLQATDLEGVEWLCLPWVPHVRQWRPPFYRGKAYFGPGHQTLAEHAVRMPLLTDYLRRGRLMSYNLSTAPSALRNTKLPFVEGKYTFSAPVALRLLAQSGAQVVRTLGVDGGAAYGRAFADIEGRTKLQTHQTSFDSQFQEMADTVRLFALQSGPLDADLPVRVYVGCMPEQDLAFRVLEYSIRRHSSLSVQVERLHEAIERRGISVPEPAAPGNRGRTPFSFQRFAIPALRDFSGRAVYLDSDMLVLRDMRALWTFDMQGQQMVSAAPLPESGRRPQFSVMLIDCERLRWDVARLVGGLDRGNYTYSQLMHEMVSVEKWRDSLPEAWNSLERYVPDETCLVHFTDMNAQPWLNPLHPHCALWTRYLLDAVRDGAITRAVIEAEVRQGNVRPSLLAQLYSGDPDPSQLPFRVLRRDLTDFLPPHLNGGPSLSRWTYEVQRVRALAAHACHKGVVRPAIRQGTNLKLWLISALTPKL